jgi:UPF0716 protein FxsA
VALLLIAIFLVISFLELWSIVAVAGVIGVGWTLMAMLALSVTGVLLMKSQGLAVWRRADAEVAAGRLPTRSLVDGAMVVLGGCLLIVPGFVTAAAGLVLLLPPTRALVRPAAMRWLQRRASRAGVMNAVFVDSVASPYASTRATRSPWGTVIGGTVVDVDSRESAPPRADIVDIEVDGPPELGPTG